MHHIDEHTIELYILGSDLVKKQITEIEAHLKECHGCRTLAGQMEAFYQNAEDGLDKLSVPEERETKALMRLPKDIIPYDVPLGAPVPYRPTTFVGKLAYFTRLHPVVTGIGSFTMMAIVAAAMTFGLKDFFKDTNPAYTHLNPERAIVEVYNRGNDLLWSFPSKSIYNLSQGQFVEFSKRVIVADLQRDRRNEIITTLPVGERVERPNPLTIFLSDGQSSREVQFQEQVQFRGANYSEAFGAVKVLCDDFGNDGKKEIIVVTNNGRSPNIINRLSNDGMILGQYFHFGDGKIATIEIGNKRGLVFLGQNDVGEPDSLSYAVMCVLDPLKIVGKTEASDSRGFGLPISSTELYVIRFPLTDMNYLWNTHSYVDAVNTTTTGGVKTYNIWATGKYGGDELRGDGYPLFEYIFDENMKILEVKFNSQTLILRKQFVSQGKLTGTIDRSYLDNLKNSVRYWNGTSWQKEPTMVKHHL